MERIAHQEDVKVEYPVSLPPTSNLTLDGGPAIGTVICKSLPSVE